MSEFKEFGKIARLNRDIVITEKIDGTNAQILIEPGITGDGACTTEMERAMAAEIANPRDTVAVVPSGPGEWDEQTSPRFNVYAGSRSRWLVPNRDGAKTDNFGFGGWVGANAAALVALLGPGRHFGEWWGAAVQRRYGQTTKRFSLFNVSKYGEVTAYLDPRCVVGVAEVRPEVVAQIEAIGDFPPVWLPPLVTAIQHKFHKGVQVCQCREARAAVSAVIGDVLVDSVPVLYRGSWFADVNAPAITPTLELNHDFPLWAPKWALDQLRRNGSAAAPGFMKPEGIVVFHEAGGVLFKATLEGDEKPKGRA